MKICVVGLGKMGLPLAVQYASKHQEVFGLDVDEKIVKKINQAEVPFPGENELPEKLSHAIEHGYLQATTDYEFSIGNSEVIVVIIPLFLDSSNNPEFSNYDFVIDMISKHVKRGSLICFETTLPVGTTRNRFAKVLEKNTGFEIGRDLFIVFSPERVSSGNVFKDLRSYPKIVGGITRKCSEKAKIFYEKVLDFDDRNDLHRENGVWLVNSSEEAEMTKLAETTYRDVNIGLANQFFLYCLKNEIDFYQVAEAANSQFYSNIHKPGISVGGHCIPVYPHFYLHKDKQATIVEAARNLNEIMPIISVEIIEEKIGNLKNKKILIEGISYRTGVKEVYGSGVWKLINELEKKEAEIFVHDSKYSDFELEELNLKKYIYRGGEVDLVILHTEEENSVEFIKQVSKSETYCFDGRNYLAGKNILDFIPIFGFTKVKEN